MRAVKAHGWLGWGGSGNEGLNVGIGGVSRARGQSLSPSLSIRLIAEGGTASTHRQRLILLLLPEDAQTKSRQDTGGDNETREYDFTSGMICVYTQHISGC